MFIVQAVRSTFFLCWVTGSVSHPSPCGKAVQPVLVFAIARSHRHVTPKSVMMEHSCGFIRGLCEVTLNRQIL